MQTKTSTKSLNRSMQNRSSSTASIKRKSSGLIKNIQQENSQQKSIQLYISDLKKLAQEHKLNQKEQLQSYKNSKQQLQNKQRNTSAKKTTMNSSIINTVDKGKSQGRASNLLRQYVTKLQNQEAEQRPQQKSFANKRHSMQPVRSESKTFNRKSSASNYHNTSQLSVTNQEPSQTIKSFKNNKGITQEFDLTHLTTSCSNIQIQPKSSSVYQEQCPFGQAKRSIFKDNKENTYFDETQSIILHKVQYDQPLQPYCVNIQSVKHAKTPQKVLKPYQMYECTSSERKRSNIIDLQQFSSPFNNVMGNKSTYSITKTKPLTSQVDNTAYNQKTAYIDLSQEMKYSNLSRALNSNDDLFSYQRENEVELEEIHNQFVHFFQQKKQLLWMIEGKESGQSHEDLNINVVSICESELE